MAEAFKASPGIHKGLVNTLRATPVRVVNPDAITLVERELAEGETLEAVKVAVMISAADKKRFAPLKRNLSNEYILGEDKYPGTTKVTKRLIINYEGPNTLQYYHQPPRYDSNGVAFIQQGRGEKGGRGGRSGRGVCGGQGRRANATGRGAGAKETAIAL